MLCVLRWVCSCYVVCEVYYRKTPPSTKLKCLLHVVHDAFVVMWRCRHTYRYRRIYIYTATVQHVDRYRQISIHIICRCINTIGCMQMKSKPICRCRHKYIHTSVIFDTYNKICGSLSLTNIHFIEIYKHWTPMSILLNHINQSFHFVLVSKEPLF